ncbi:MAG: hypothetical protein RBU37_04310 [Myxococcota bacterium]|nr:hypothetical protein [Myxococcota bacterium]
MDSEQRFALLLELSQDELPWARELAIDLLPGELEGRAERAALLLQRLRDARAAGEVQALILILREQTELPLDEELLRLAEHEEPDLRYQALAALELRANDSEAFRLLLRRALEDEDDELASVSAQGLARLSERSALSALRARRAHAAVGLRLHFDLARARLGDDVSAELLEALSDTSTRFAALLAIAEFRVKAALPLCAKLSRSWFGDPFVRVAAAYAQACLGDADGCQRLYRWAEGRSDWNTYAAERLLTLLLEETADVDPSRLHRIFEGWLFGASERLASSAVDNLQRWASSSARALLERASQSKALCDASVAELVRSALLSFNGGASPSKASEGQTQ